jgi:hypothetical protein
VSSKVVIAPRSFARARPEIVTVRAVVPVDVMLLGPRVECDGTAVTFDTRKAIALLAVLALADRLRPRDVLAELLWPEHDAEHARGALRGRCRHSAPRSAATRTASASCAARGCRSTSTSSRADPAAAGRSRRGGLKRRADARGPRRRRTSSGQLGDRRTCSPERARKGPAGAPSRHRC